MVQHIVTYIVVVAVLGGKTQGRSKTHEQITGTAVVHKAEVSGGVQRVVPVVTQTEVAFW